MKVETECMKFPIIVRKGSKQDKYQCYNSCKHINDASSTSIDINELFVTVQYIEY